MTPPATNEELLPAEPAGGGPTAPATDAGTQPAGRGRSSGKPTTDTGVLVVVNRKAGAGDSDLDAALERLRGAFDSLRVIDAADPQALRDELVGARREAIGAVVVAGGDGTINGALAALLETGLPLGVIPLGTANDFARTLNLPGEPEEAAGVIVGGRTRRIDVGTVNGRPFLNAAGVGFSSELSRQMPSALKAAIGSLAYPLGVLRGWRRHRPFSVLVQGEGFSLRRRVIQVTVANGRYYGGGMTAHQSASIDDGVLDIVLVIARPWWRLLFSLIRLRRGIYAKDAPVVAERAGVFTLSTRKPKPVAADGEPLANTPASFTVLERALAVYVPAGDLPEQGE